MQQKLTTLGVSESAISFQSQNSSTPNNSQNLPTNNLQKSRAYTPIILKTEPPNSIINPNSTNFFSEGNLNNIDNSIATYNNNSNGIENENNSNNQYHIGRWTEEEHKRFIDGILEYGNEWKKVQLVIKTRSSTQARSHAQKFFLRVKKMIKMNGGNFNFNEKEKILENIINNILPNKKGETLTKNQKEKLLSAISSNIKYEGETNERSEDEQQIRLEEDNLKYKKEYNENDSMFKYHKSSTDIPNSNLNDNIFSQRKTSIGQKRKSSKLDSKIFFIKKDISLRPSMDISSQKINKDESNENIQNLNLKENELNQSKNNEFNNKKNNIGSHNINDNFENKNNINGCVINNYINVTNNFMNNKYICNYCNNDIINNNFNYNYNYGLDYNYNYDKNDSINNDRNYSYGFFQGPDRNIYSVVDKPFLYGQFNKTIYNGFNYNNRINYNENDNNINGTNPFELNFTNFNNENYNNNENNENEQQISIHEDEFIKVNNNNTEENIDYN